MHLSNFVGAECQGADFSEATIDICNLRGTEFGDSDLANTKFVAGDFGGYDGAAAADLKDVKKLTEKQLVTSFGGSRCKLPDGFGFPDHWPEAALDEDLFEPDEEDFVGGFVQ